MGPLVLFRVGLGLVMAWEATRYWRKGWIADWYISPQFFFKYWGFEWVRPWPGDGMYWHFGALFVLGLCVALGAGFRVAAVLSCLGWGFVFLLDATHYLNHMYLLVLLLGLLAAVPAHHALSVDAWLRPGLRSAEAPRWALWLLRFQVAVPYVFGAVAKWNADWLLRAEPLRTWLLARTDFPVIGSDFTQPWAAYFFAWGGMLFDLLIVPALMWRRSRPMALVALFGFHLSNAELFHIGVFPWFMLVGSFIFLPETWFNRLSGPSGAVLPPPTPTRRAVIVGLLSAWVLVQVVLPLRHLAYPSDVAWSEEGGLFAWRMKLTQKDLSLTFYGTRADGTTRELNPGAFLTPRQYQRMGARPDLILQTAKELARRSGEPMQVRAEVECSLNGRSHREFVDPTVDLAAQPWTLGPATWVRPFVDAP